MPWGPIIGVVLAGGRSSRMVGGQKFLRDLGGLRLLDHVTQRLTPQVDRVVISTNGNRDGLSASLHPLVDDDAHAGRGPLAGILAGLRWAARAEGAGARIVVVPSDSPLLPTDLVARLTEAAPANGIAVASCDGRLHCAFGLWPVSVADDLERWLDGSDTSSIRAFLATQTTVEVNFPGAGECFANVNTPIDLEAIRTRFEPIALPNQAR